MSENQINCVRRIAEIAETLSTTERAILLAFGEGMVAKSELERARVVRDGQLHGATG